MDRAGEGRAAAGLDPNPEASSHSTVPLSTPPHGAFAGAAPALAAGDMVKHYEIVRELGRGGMGSVFLARDTRLARLCAIKLLHAYSGSGAARFLAEARATARCKHENIVTIHEVDEIHGHPYMVLEYLEGRTLRAWMAAHPSRLVMPRVAVELMVPVVRALVCAHALGIVHRDLKPENIFLTHAGQVKVLDFGIAKRIEAGEVTGAIASARAMHTDPTLTRQGALVGTLPYMSPEQWLGMDITQQADLWAVGVMLYELVTGSHPLAPATMPRLLEVQDLDRPMPGVRDQRQDVGKLGDVIDRCLKKAVSERIATAGELLGELARLVADGEVPAPANRRRRRRTAAMVTAGATLAAVLALLAAGLPGRLRGAGSTGIAITDVPLPTSRHPEARAAYDAALHGFRDANWTIAEDQLRRAIALDPTLAAAQLRLAILLNYTAGRIPETRRSYALAAQWRAGLSPRDREILATFEPLFMREPADLVGFMARLTELARTRAEDAEVLAMLALFGTDDPQIRLRAAQRAVEIDPRYADAWQAAGKQLFALGRRDESLRAFDACLAVSPAAVDCLGERAQVHSAQGQCAAAAADLRNAAAASPGGRHWRDLQASSLMAVGQPVEAAIEVLSQKWAVQPEARRELVELHDRARLDLLRGHFDDARAGALALRARTQHQTDADQHARYATILLDLAVEAEQLDDAAQVADDYVRRRAAWVSAGILDDDMVMLTALRDAGRLSIGDYEVRRAAWLAGRRDLAGSVRAAIWLAAWVQPASTPEQAAAALAAAPSGDLRLLAPGIAGQAALGTALLRAGRAAEAIPFLERAAHRCDGFVAPVAQVRAAAQLGRALEVTGDRAGACAAYQRVLDHWGAARSATARDARLRATALGCAPGAGTSPGPAGAGHR